MTTSKHPSQRHVSKRTVWMVCVVVFITSTQAFGACTGRFINPIGCVLVLYFSDHIGWVPALHRRYGRHTQP